MKPFEPWKQYPSFTEERLVTVAGIMRDVRRTAVALHESAAGDTDWSLGCRIYSRTCHALTLASQEFSWLRILPELERPLRFVFAIGSIPVRFYRGLPDDPPDRYLFISDAESCQRQLALQLEEIPSLHKLFRLAVEADGTTREASKIVLVELTKAGTPTSWYSIPIAPITKVTRLQAPAVNVPQPTLEPAKDKEKPAKKDREQDAG